MLTLKATDETAQLRIGAALAAAVPAACIIYLEGDLGAGKTTLVRGFLQGMGHTGAVKSPTYTLMEPYQLNGRSVCHFDLYRLGDPEELEYLGLRDLLEQPVILMIEWPGQGAGWLPPADLTIRIQYAESGRRLDLIPETGAGEQIIDYINNELQQYIDKSTDK